MSVQAEAVWRPPQGRIVGMQARMQSSEEIRRESVLPIVTRSDLYHPYLGVSEATQPCEFCHNDWASCPGHYGSIEFPIPVFRVHYLQRLVSILNLVCINCQRARFPVDHRVYRHALQLPACERIDYLKSKMGKASAFCGGNEYKAMRKEMGCDPISIVYDFANDRTIATWPDHPERVIDGCLRPHVRFAVEGGGGKSVIKGVVKLLDRTLDAQGRHGQRDQVMDPEYAVRAVRARRTSDDEEDDDDDDDGDDEDAVDLSISFVHMHTSPTQFGPVEMFHCLRMISDETKEWMGLGEHNDPQNLMWDVLPVTPMNVRPSLRFSGVGGARNKDYNEISRIYESILKSRDSLIHVMERDNHKITLIYYSVRCDNKWVECVQYEDALDLMRLPPAERLSKWREIDKLQRARTHSGRNAVDVAWRQLNASVASLQSHAHRNRQNTYGKTPSSIDTRYTGKMGRFRGSIAAHRVNLCGRAVLGPSITNIMPHQAGIPREVAMGITMRVELPEPSAANLASRAMQSRIRQACTWITNGPYTYPGANHVILRDGTVIDLTLCEDRRRICIDDVRAVLRHLLDGDWVCVNRQPTLHRPSMMGYEVKVLDQYVISLHYAVFKAKGADCDGDEVNLFVAQDMESQVELREICSVESQILKDGNVWIGFIQNSVVGAYILTRGSYFTREEAMQLVMDTMDGDVTKSDGGVPRFSLPPPAILKPRRMWTGHQIVSMLFPNTLQVNEHALEGDPTDSASVCVRDGELLRGVLDAKALNGAHGIVSTLYRTHPKRFRTVQLLHQGYLMFQRAVDLHGLSISFHDTYMTRDDFLDKNAGPSMRDYLRTLDEYTRRFGRYVPGIETAVDLNIRKHVDTVVSASSQHVSEWVRRKDPHCTRNSLMMMIECGAKGSLMTVNQLAGMVGQLYVDFQRYPHASSHFNGRIHESGVYDSPYSHCDAYGLIPNSYSLGMRPRHLLQQFPPAIESVMTKNKGTSTSGYTSRRIINAQMGLSTNVYGQVTDGFDRVVWDSYGNDNYDSQHLVTVALPTATNAAAAAAAAQGVDTDPQPFVDAVVPRALGRRRHSESLSAFAREYRAQLDIVWRIYHSHFDRGGEPAKTKSPFDLHALVQSVAHTPKQQQQQRQRPPQRDEEEEEGDDDDDDDGDAAMTADDYAEWVLDSWRKLCADGLVQDTNAPVKFLWLHHMSPGLMLRRYRLDRQQLQYVYAQVERACARCMLHTGEAVGIVAGQQLGEPLTQMSLKTTHFAGKFTRVQHGPNRIRDLIECTEHTLAQTATMRITLGAHIQDEIDAQIFGVRIVESHLRDVVIDTIHTEWLADADPAPLDASSGQSSPMTANSCVLHMKLDRTQCIERMLTPRLIVKRLLQYDGFQTGDEAKHGGRRRVTKSSSASSSSVCALTYDMCSFCEATDTEAWTIRICVPFDSGIWKTMRKTFKEDARRYSGAGARNRQTQQQQERQHQRRLRYERKSGHFVDSNGTVVRERDCLVADMLAMNMLESVPIGGIQGIQNFVVEYHNRAGVPDSTDRHSGRWVVSTLGSNLREVLKLRDVDRHRTITSNIIEMYRVFGMFATRESIVHEFLQVMRNMADKRHIQMLASFMTMDRLRDFQIGSVEDILPFLQRAGYEKAPRQFTQACTNAEYDQLKSVIGTVMANASMHTGTGTVRVHTKDDRRREIHAQDSAWSIAFPPFPARVKNESGIAHARWSTSNVFRPRFLGTRVYVVFYHTSRGVCHASIVDRNARVYRVWLEKQPESMDIFKGTIIEGVLVPSNDHDRQTTPRDARPTLIVNDLHAVCGNACSTLRYEHRLDIARELLCAQLKFTRTPDTTTVRDHGSMGLLPDIPYAVPISARTQECARGHILQSPCVPFGVVVNRAYHIRGLEGFLSHADVLVNSAIPAHGVEFLDLNEPATTSERRIRYWVPPEEAAHSHTVRARVCDDLHGLPPPIELEHWYYASQTSQKRRSRRIIARDHKTPCDPDESRLLQAYRCTSVDAGMEERVRAASMRFVGLCLDGCEDQFLYSLGAVPMDWTRTEMEPRTNNALEWCWNWKLQLWVLAKRAGHTNHNALAETPVIHITGYEHVLAVARALDENLQAYELVS